MTPESAVDVNEKMERRLEGLQEKKKVIR